MTKPNTASAITRSVCSIFLVQILLTGCCSAQGQTKTANTQSGVQLDVGSEQYPDADAIILRWEQYWEIKDDGQVVRREHKWIKLMNSRPIRRTADPRLDFCEGTDKLTIHTARTILPSGEVIDVPEYSFNIAAPDDVAGWPDYIAWQQTVVSFSGIEPGATLELDYEVTTQRGVLPWVSADIRLDDDYPVLKRIISISRPANVKLSVQLDNVEHEPTPDGSCFAFGPFDGSPAEPQSQPWQHRCPRLRFTTIPDSTTWVGRLLGIVSRAAVQDEDIRTFAVDATADNPDVKAKISALADKLRARFSYLASAKTYRSLQCRPADEVFSQNYGNPLEAAALYLAALKSLDIKVEPALAVKDIDVTQRRPTRECFAGIVLVAHSNEGPIMLHPQHGMINTPDSWDDDIALVSLDSDGSLRTTNLHNRKQKGANAMKLSGSLAVNEDGQLQGSLRLRLAGGFFDPQQLKTSDAQESFLQKVVCNTIPAVENLTSSITTMSHDKLEATITLNEDNAIELLDEYYLMEMPGIDWFSWQFPIPLGSSKRITSVQLDGSFTAEVDLIVKIPDTWVFHMTPKAGIDEPGHWGAISQTVSTDEASLHINRRISVPKSILDPEDFSQLRRAANQLRAPGNSIVALSPR